MSPPPPTIERPQSVNGCWRGSECYSAMNRIVLFLNRNLCGQSLQSDRVYNFTNMHSMSYKSDFILVAVESIFKNPQFPLQYCFFQQSFESDYPAFRFRLPCRIQNLWTPRCSRSWSLPKMNTSLFLNWVTWSFWMIGGLHWMSTRSSLLLGIILDRRLRGDPIYTAELSRPAVLASYRLFVIKFFAIHQNMGPAQLGNTCWQKVTWQS